MNFRRLHSRFPLPSSVSIPISQSNHSKFEDGIRFANCSALSLGRVLLLSSPPLKLPTPCVSSKLKAAVGGCFRKHDGVAVATMNFDGDLRSLRGVVVLQIIRDVSTGVTNDYVPMHHHAILRVCCANEYVSFVVNDLQHGFHVTYSGFRKSYASSPRSRLNPESRVPTYVDIWIHPVDAIRLVSHLQSGSLVDISNIVDRHLFESSIFEANTKTSAQSFPYRLNSSRCVCFSSTNNMLSFKQGFGHTGVHLQIFSSCARTSCQIAHPLFSNFLAESNTTSFCAPFVSLPMSMYSISKTSSGRYPSVCQRIHTLMRRNSFGTFSSFIAIFCHVQEFGDTDTRNGISDGFHGFDCAAIPKGNCITVIGSIVRIDVVFARLVCAVCGTKIVRDVMCLCGCCPLRAHCIVEIFVAGWMESCDNTMNPFLAVGDAANSFTLGLTNHFLRYEIFAKADALVELRSDLCGFLQLPSERMEFVGSHQGVHHLKFIRQQEPRESVVFVMQKVRKICSLEKIGYLVSSKKSHFNSLGL